MPESKLLKEISQKEGDKRKTAEKVIANPELLSEVFQGLSADRASIKYGSEKILRIISEEEPEILYRKMDAFIENLDSDNNFLKWGAIHVIANLAAVDSKDKFEEIFDKYFAPISGPVLITAANIIAGAAKIAMAKPELAERITRELLKVEKAKYQTTECRNIALGKVIESFDQFYDQIADREPVLRLVKKQLQNTRKATRKKAEKFLERRSTQS